MQINVGFIGGGPRARSLWNSLISNEEMEDIIYPKAVLDINEEILSSWRYLVDKTYKNFDSFLKEDLDAVIIATPPNTHAHFAKKCLELGIDTWCEVPMGLSLDDLFGIIDAEKGNKGNKGHYFYGENYCYHLATQFIAEKNGKNAIGNIYYAEGEYTHSVEHYMIEENFYHKAVPELDPELHHNTRPTWRATFEPIKYGHAFGPCLYVLKKNKLTQDERPISVCGMGNMKMLKRFNTDNFQIALVKTNKETIIKFVIGFVLGIHGRIFVSFWGSQGLFMEGSFQCKNKHYYVEVPEEKGFYPERLNQKPKILTDEDLIEMGAPYEKGGHGGADTLMFKTWIKNILNKEKFDIDVYDGAEMTAPGICASESLKTEKFIDIPNFRK
ncbi:MAG: Gfo/Idh/MocA family protein [Promethearchaeota archaeon]